MKNSVTYLRVPSDTEVILHAYEEYGLDILNRFNGMWAFALYDKKKSQLILCRDRFGVKPLYFHIAGKRIIFSSMISAILTHDIEKQPEDSVIEEFLSFNLLDHTSKTFFRNILSLNPGSFLIYNLDTCEYSVKKWYTLTGREERPNSEIRDIFFDSVARRTVSDVPVGSV